MPRTGAPLAAVTVALVVIIGGPRDKGSAQTTRNPGFKASIGIRTTPNRLSGARDGGTYIGGDLLPGESIALIVTAGHGGDVCTSGIAGPIGSLPPQTDASVARQKASALYVWQFDVGVLEVQTNKITFDLSWQRTSNVPPDLRLHQSQRLTLREGESFPIDLLHGAPGSDCVSNSVAVVAGIQDDPALVNKTIEWDLWLSTDPRTAVHQVLASLQGDKAEFQFDPLSVRTGVGGAVQGVLCYGDLTGRVRLDGAIDVALNMQRVLGTLADPTNLMRFKKNSQRFRSSASSGQKNFTMEPGETVKIVLPALNTSSPVRTITDPVTGERTTTAVPSSARPQSAPVAGLEMSITVQAHIR
jgi:hypothetical protein